jgi:phospholipid/cholesterol/gamma-HCH transport system permease protein
MDGDAKKPSEVPLSGAVRLTDVVGLRRRVAEATHDPSSKLLHIDLSQVQSLDGGVAAVLVAIRDELRSRGIAVTFQGAEGRVRSLLDLYASRPDIEARKPPPARRGVLDEVGQAAMKVLAMLKGDLEFVGEYFATMLDVVRHPRSVDWSEVSKLAEQVGANGLPVVALVSVLVGFIIAFQSANELQKYGANLMIADLVGLTMSREMGPIMACLITVSRSGSAFTAELGTMKVNEEVDALRALGINPIKFLVAPRVLAMTFVMPLLTVFADIVGVLGGLVVAVTVLELGTRSYFTECQAALVPRDVLFGVGKSAVFAFAGALIACHRGLSARRGAEGVGRATTSAVVQMIIAVIVLDAVFSFFSSEYGL